MLALDLQEVRRLGVKQAAQRAVEHLTAADRPTQGFFIHLDSDVVSDALMPAVDYRIPDGLSWDELRTVIETALASGRAVGIEITIYNPSLDADGSSGRELAPADPEPGVRRSLAKIAKIAKKNSEFSSF